MIETDAMNSVRLYYITLPHQNDEPTLLEPTSRRRWLAELSEAKRQAVTRLVNERDRDISLLALYLLKQLAIDESLDSFHLCDIEYPENAKPVWSKRQADAFDFNISHSARLVAVAASRTTSVGLDVEKIKQLKSLKFKMVMSADELASIEDTPSVFFDLWSIKEAVVKAADTTGIARMRDVVIDGDIATLDGDRWQLTALADHLGSDDYAAYLATSAPVDELKVRQLSIDELT